MSFRRMVSSLSLPLIAACSGTLRLPNPLNLAGKTEPAAATEAPSAAAPSAPAPAEPAKPALTEREKWLLGALGTYENQVRDASQNGYITIDPHLGNFINHCQALKTEAGPYLTEASAPVKSEAETKLAAVCADFEKFVQSKAKKTEEYLPSKAPGDRGSESAITSRLKEYFQTRKLGLTPVKIMMKDKDWSPYRNDLGIVIERRKGALAVVRGSDDRNCFMAWTYVYQTFDGVNYDRSKGGISPTQIATPTPCPN